jgi:hypothetical protein
LAAFVRKRTEGGRSNFPAASVRLAGKSFRELGESDAKAMPVKKVSALRRGRSAQQSYARVSAAVPGEDVPAYDR